MNNDELTVINEHPKTENQQLFESINALGNGFFEMQAKQQDAERELELKKLEIQKETNALKIASWERVNIDENKLISQNLNKEFNFKIYFILSTVIIILVCSILNCLNPAITGFLGFIAGHAFRDTTNTFINNLRSSKKEPEELKVVKTEQQPNE